MNTEKFDSLGLCRFWANRIVQCALFQKTPEMWATPEEYQELQRVTSDLTDLFDRQVFAELREANADHLVGALPSVFVRVLTRGEQEREVLRIMEEAIEEVLRG